MRRFVGRPWLATAFATFVISFLTSLYIPALSLLGVPLGLAFLVLDISRPTPPPPEA